VVYREGLVLRVRGLAPDGVDEVDGALDVAGSRVLPELIELAGGWERVVTIVDFGGASARSRRGGTLGRNRGLARSLSVWANQLERFHERRTEG
jgi:hypothetical protein